MKQEFSLSDLEKLKFNIKIPGIIFLNWDLGAGKTTLSKHILKNILNVQDEVRSPTYTYYNKYNWIFNWKKIDIFHFDLYRLENYDEFFAIWAEEIFDNNSWIIIVEWPDLIKDYYKADLEIYLYKTQNLNSRIIEINN
jgi:tRNA threonylcarbamoyladenosine biosynthesis protein TsaE